MKVLKLITFLLLGILGFNSCYKDDARPWNETPKAPIPPEKVVAKSDFDWKTTKNYQLTLKGSVSHVVKITSASGAVYQKVVLTAGTDCVTLLTLPSYEKSVHLVNGTLNIELQLSGPTLTYSF